jgi:hypothetical protein
MPTPPIDAQGTGEASVVAAMDFVPAELPSKPVDRGFQIQKVGIVSQTGWFVVDCRLTGCFNQGL